MENKGVVVLQIPSGRNPIGCIENRPLMISAYTSNEFRMRSL